MRQYSSSISDSKSSKTTGEVTSSEEVVRVEAAGETGGEAEAGSSWAVEAAEAGSIEATTADCCNLVGLMCWTSQGTSQNITKIYFLSSLHKSAIILY